MLLVQQLLQVNSSHFIYFGNLQFQHQLLPLAHKNLRKELLAGLRKRQVDFGEAIAFRAVGEVGNNERLHYHYCIYADHAVKHRTMKTIFSDASPCAVTLSHDPPKKGIIAASKYMFKDIVSVRRKQRFIRLFLKYAPPITWGTSGFYQPTLAEAERKLKTNDAVKQAFAY